MGPIERAQLRAENAVSIVRWASRALRDHGHDEDADALDAYVERIDHDAPLFDCTDAAPPAWWRGHDYTAKRFGDIVRRFRAAQLEIARLRALAEPEHLPSGTPLPGLPPKMPRATR